MKIIPFLAILLALGLAHPVHAAAAPDISVNVSGLVCDFCAQSIRSMFEKESSVSSVNVDLDKGLITIDLKDAHTIDDEKVKKMITDAGYTVNEIVHHE